MLQEAVELLEAWAEKNYMILNESKIKVMLFGPNITGKELSLTINSNVIEQKMLFTFPGVLLNPVLYITKHIEHIATKVRKAMHKIAVFLEENVEYQ